MKWLLQRIKAVFSKPATAAMIVVAVIGLLGTLITVLSRGAPSKSGQNIEVGGDVNAPVIQGDVNAPVIIGATPLIVTSTPLPTFTPTPVIFQTPKIYTVLENASLAGGSKQTSAVRDSTGKITVFILNGTDLGYFELFEGAVQFPPVFFDTLGPPGAPRISAAIDSADQIHMVWGAAPQASDLKYSLLNNSQLASSEIIATGAYAWDIAVDSANHPHVAWTNVDLLSMIYNGKQWLPPKKLVSGLWHPDIQLSSDDDTFILANEGQFYPATSTSVYEIDDVGGNWNDLNELSASPFWSGGAAAAINDVGDVYTVWMNSTTNNGGTDQVFFSRRINGGWQQPLYIGDVNTSAGSTGQESPAVAFDARGVFYVAWRGLNERNRPVIFVRAFVPENMPISKVTWGWSPIITLDQRDAFDVGWPTIANAWHTNLEEGIDLLWNGNVGPNQVIFHSHVKFP